MAGKFATIDEYIDSLPDEVQAIAQEVRRTIRAAVPEPGETISYQMPTITLDGESLAYFAVWKNHVGLYPPVPTEDEALEREVAPYRGPKGNFRFPLSAPIPYDLIRRLTAILVRERLAQTSAGNPVRF